MNCTEIKITNLIENHTDNSELVSEHGLSLFLETADFKCLIDSGQSGAFVDNAKKLGVDLANCDYIFVSHNHYDHVGGIKRLLEINPDIKIIAADACNISTLKVLCDEDAERIKNPDGFSTAELSLLPKKAGGLESLLKEKTDNFILTANEIYRLSDNIYIMKPDKSEPEFLCCDKYLATEKYDKVFKDEFEHERFLAIERCYDVIIISSCNHCGIVNIAKTACEKFGKPVSHIVGGFHLRGSDDNSLNCDEAYIGKLCQRLEYYGVSDVYTGHCTGILGLEILKKYLGDKVRHFKCGEILKI